MTATAAQVARMRRMVDEPTEATYDDDTLEAYIERYPLMDELGTAPYYYDTSTTPPTQTAYDDWIPTYDLHAAAADVWDEKAAGVAEDFDFSADGGSCKRSQVNEAYQAKARWHRQRRSPKTFKAVQWPEEDGDSAFDWIVNKVDV